jgi:peptidoglycan/xylan/chitin deacetylase (PgdA/CDA1 family)
MSLLILTYHYFHSGQPTGVPDHDFDYALHTNVLLRQLKHMQESAVAPISPEYPFFFNDRSPERKEVLVTIDDGHVSVEEEALEIFLKAGIKPLLAVSSGRVGQENFMTWSTLRGLASYGFAIQSHGKTHSDLTELDSTALNDELGDSKKAIEDNIGLAVHVLAVPMGRINRRVADAARGAGYKAILTSYTGINHHEPDRYLLRRFQVKAKTRLDPLAKYFNPLSGVRLAGGLKNIARRFLP